MMRRRQNIPIKNYSRKQKYKIPRTQARDNFNEKIQFRLGLRWLIYFLKFCKGTECGYKKDSEILRLMNTVPPGV